MQRMPLHACPSGELPSKDLEMFPSEREIQVPDPKVCGWTIDDEGSLSIDWMRTPPVLPIFIQTKKLKKTDQTKDHFLPKKQTKYRPIFEKKQTNLYKWLS